MTLGQRIKQARLDAGLSQRQLCGDAITRNMLSLIETGAAKPSMATLSYLAGRLGKPVSYFLQENIVISPNLELMARARASWAEGDAGAALKILEDFREPDSNFQQERRLLLVLCSIALARQAIENRKLPYAAQLLEQAAAWSQSCSYAVHLERQRLLLLAQTRQHSAEHIVSQLPDLDEELHLRAQAALDQGDFRRAEQLLDAARDRTDPQWCLLKADACFAQKDYASAAEYYRLVQHRFSRQVYPRLEICCRELGDYKGAYEYACLQRE